MAKKYTDEEIERFLRTIKWLGILAVLLLIGLIGLGMSVNRNVESFERAARFRPIEDGDDSTAGSVPTRLDPSEGHLVYVPAYSHVYHRDGEPVLMTVTLSIRNTSVDRTITISTVRYYDTEGDEVRSFLKSPITLDPLATREFLISRDDTSGGSGANFLVQWSSEKTVSDPVIEAVMIATEQRQGISFVRPGVPISSPVPQKKPAADEQ